jgi:3-hydroxyacyl-CoA dehydrogenase
VPGLSKDVEDIPITKVGVIGGGLMGGGIAMNFANVGMPVTIIETSQEALDRGLGTIRKNYENTARRGRLTEEAVEQRCGLIQGSLDMTDLAGCDLIIEAVFENMAVKKEIFTRLDGIAKQGAILASNTSALDINEIAAVTSRPESVVGLHFFSPANVMKLLEVVRGDKTSDAVVKTSMALAKRIRKVAVLVGVCMGFVGNRILFMRQHEASRLALEGAPIEQVDKVLFDFGFPMGAFQMGDLAGLDLGWDKQNSNPIDVKDRLCDLGRYGQKTGAGYYDYDDKRRPTPAVVTAELFAEVAASQGIERGSITDEEVLDRCLLPMINEGAKILDEGIAMRASDIDVVYVYGYGWPVYRGGPMHYANSLGLDKVLAKIRHYHETTGDDFWAPSPLLISLAEQGKSFQ